jgi:hypothetical protein
MVSFKNKKVPLWRGLGGGFLNYSKSSGIYPVLPLPPPKGDKMNT